MANKLFLSFAGAVTAAALAGALAGASKAQAEMSGASSYCQEDRCLALCARIPKICEKMTGLRSHYRFLGFGADSHKEMVGSGISPWTDITATTAATSVVLKALGYNPTAKVLSVPATYRSLKNGDIDVFLGNWMPTMEAELKPYRDDGSIETIAKNLTGAKYTLAVNKLAADGGIKGFGDIAKYSKQLEGKIYGIEPGNGGNRLIQGMIDKNSFGQLPCPWEYLVASHHEGRERA